MTHAEAHVAAMALVRLLATGHSDAAVKDRILIDVGRPHGLEAVLEVIVASCELLEQVLAVYATEPGGEPLAVIDRLTRVLESEL